MVTKLRIQCKAVSSERFGITATMHFHAALHLSLLCLTIYFLNYELKLLCLNHLKIYDLHVYQHAMNYVLQEPGYMFIPVKTVLKEIAILDSQQINIEHETMLINMVRSFFCYFPLPPSSYNTWFTQKWTLCAWSQDKSTIKWWGQCNAKKWRVVIVPWKTGKNVSVNYRTTPKLLDHVDDHNFEGLNFLNSRSWMELNHNSILRKYNPYCHHCQYNNSQSSASNLNNHILYVYEKNI